MAVVTIAREYGSGGSVVAELLADELGATVIDRSLIAEVARRAALPRADVEADDELPVPFLERFARAFVPVGDAVAGWAARPELLVDQHAQIVAFTQAAIVRAARLGQVVVVGRGGAALLRDHPGAVHAYLWAPLESRIRVVAERIGCDAATARRRIHDVDGRRAAYVREVYGVDRGDRSRYDLVLDTARIGNVGAAAAILAVGRSPRTLQAEEREAATIGG